MTSPAHDADGVLAQFADDDTKLSTETAAVAVLNRSEVEAQLDAAHRYPRSTKSFLKDAIGLATLTRPVAESCIYALPRAGKVISGPSVRLAEIVASAYGNLHVASRVLDAEDKEIVAQGVAWDLEKNLRVTVEARRRITKKGGQRYDDDMIGVAGAAAGSIALRNAIFRVVPRAYIDAIYAEVRKVAVGDAMTLDTRRAEVVSRLEKIGVPRDRVFLRLGRKALEDVTLEDVEVLIGLGTAIKQGEGAIDALFPPVGGAPKTTDASRSLEAELREAPPKESAPAAKPEPKAAKGKKGEKPAPAEEPKTAHVVDASKALCPGVGCGKPVDMTKGGIVVEGQAWHDDCLAFAKQQQREPGQEG